MFHTVAEQASDVLEGINAVVFKVNAFAGALNIGADDFLTYAMDEYHEKKAAANS